MALEDWLSGLGAAGSAAMDTYAWEKQRRDAEAARQHERDYRRQRDEVEDTRYATDVAEKQRQQQAQREIVKGLETQLGPDHPMVVSAKAALEGLTLSPDALKKASDPDPHDDVEANMPEWLRPIFHGRGHTGSFSPEEWSESPEMRRDREAKEAADKFARDQAASREDYEWRKQTDRRYAPPVTPRPTPEQAAAADAAKRAADLRDYEDKKRIDQRYAPSGGRGGRSTDYGYGGAVTDDEGEPMVPGFKPKGSDVRLLPEARPMPLPITPRAGPATPQPNPIGSAEMPTPMTAAPPPPDLSALVAQTRALLSQVQQERDPARKKALQAQLAQARAQLAQAMSGR
jgi:hypothetical protein